MQKRKTGKVLEIAIMLVLTSGVCACGHTNAQIPDAASSAPSENAELTKSEMPSKSKPEDAKPRDAQERKMAPSNGASKNIQEQPQKTIEAESAASISTSGPAIEETKANSDPVQKTNQTEGGDKEQAHDALDSVQESEAKPEDKDLEADPTKTSLEQESYAELLSRELPLNIKQTYTVIPKSEQIDISRDYQSLNIGDSTYDMYLDTEYSLYTGTKLSNMTLSKYGMVMDGDDGKRYILLYGNEIIEDAHWSDDKKTYIVNKRGWCLEQTEEEEE